MKIIKAIVTPVHGGYYNDDLEAIRNAAATMDGFFYKGTPVAPGFHDVRQPSQAASFLLVLSGGQVAVGDALSVAYSQAGGRRGLFTWDEQLPFLGEVCRFLEGRRITRFSELCSDLQNFEFSPRLHRPAAFYGASQALLSAVALAEAKTPAEVLASELECCLADSPVPIYIQGGDDRYSSVDKAIMRRVGALPHGLVNDIDTTLGWKGERLLEYVAWVVRRISDWAEESYRPEIHIDAYGLPGVIFEHDLNRLADYLGRLADTARPYSFCMETPVLMSSRQAQIETFAGLRQRLAKNGVPVRLVVDEWANSLEDIRAFIAAEATDMINVKSPDLGTVLDCGRAVLECWSGNVRPILGGSCVDTDVSARTIAHVALATQPAWVMARPGMGVDEGFQIVQNEMLRTLAVIERRPPVSSIHSEMIETDVR